MSRCRRALSIAFTMPLIAAVAVVSTGVRSGASPFGRDSVSTPAAGLPPLGDRMWDLESDFGITATNPQPDSYGDANVWSWMEGSQLTSPSTFTLLPHYTSSQFDVPGLLSWQGPDSRSQNDNLPQVSLNATGRIIDGATNQSAIGGIYWPRSTILIHPLSDDAIVHWKSPVSGTVQLTVSVVKFDRACGDGESWQVDRGGTRLAGGIAGNAAGPEGTYLTICVTVGTDLYLAIGPGPGGLECGSTGVTFTVTM